MMTKTPVGSHICQATEEEPSRLCENVIVSESHFDMRVQMKRRDSKVVGRRRDARLLPRVYLRRRVAVIERSE